MKDIIEKLGIISEEVTKEKKGELRLLALIKRTDIEGKWDIVFAADWLTKANGESDLIYFINKLKSKFSGKLDFISRIFIASANDPFMKQLAKAILRDGRSIPGELTSLYVSPTLTIGAVTVICNNFDETLLEDIDEKDATAGRPLAGGEITRF